MHPKLNKPDYKDMSLLIFQEEFRGEEDCKGWLFKTRWPEGFRCPNCNHDTFTMLAVRQIYMCNGCRYQASLTAGTIFHKSRTPLLKWFWLIFRMATSKTGVSIAEMQRELEIKDYKTMWVMAHKVRKAMADRDINYKLAGLVEIDESLFGPSSTGKRGRGAKRKELVIVAVSVWVDSSGKEKPGFAHAFLVEDATANTIKDILKRMSIPDDEIDPLINKIRTDGWQAYKTVTKDLGLAHNRAVLKDQRDALKLLPWTHRLIGNVKAVIAGPHRGVSGKHLQRYLSEICYRFNRRFWGKQAFHRLLNACVSTDTITRDQLMDKIC